MGPFPPYSFGTGARHSPYAYDSRRPRGKGRVGLRRVHIRCPLVTESLPAPHYSEQETERSGVPARNVRLTVGSPFRCSCIVGSLHSTFAAGSSAISGSAAMALHRKPTPGPSGRSLSALSVGAEVSGHVGQEDLVVTADTDCLPRRCLCHPYAHEACVCLYASDIHPRRLSSTRRYALRSDPRKLLSSLAVYGSLSFRRVLSASLRGHTAKASTSTCPRMARPFMHLPPRSQSPRRAIARMCPYPCALRSALSTARLPHESIRSKPIPPCVAASACTLVAIPHAVVSAECRVVTKRGHHRAPNRIFRKNQRGARELAP